MTAGQLIAASRPLNVEAITSGYDRPDVLKQVSIEARPGEVTCILGANGAGKSTLIRAILGLITVRTGEVRFGDARLNGMPPHRIVALGIGVVPEGNRVLPRMTVAENLQVGGLLQRDARKVAARMEEMFAVFPRLRERRRQLAGTLSGGERSMLSIARGLMTEPELVVFDEPSLGLSPLLVEEMFALIGRLNGDGLAILLVEQNVVQSLAIAHRAYVLENGRITLSGKAADLAQDPELRKSYLGH